MGCVKNIAVNAFPKQSSLLGSTVGVCFNYNTKEHIVGWFVRDDSEEPWITIIELNDGRFVLSTECQYRLV